MGLSIENSSLLRWASGKLSSKGDDAPMNVVLWRYRLCSQYGWSGGFKFMPRLRLLFGAHGSGSDWLVRALVYFDKSMPCFYAPSEKIDPPLVSEDRRWVLPLNYTKELNGSHPYEHLLKSLSQPKKSLLQRSMNQCDEADAADIQKILVYEPNALLMSESLVRTYRIPMIFMVTDPVYCADRYLASEPDEESGYLQDEFATIRRSAFLLRFIRKDARRVRKAHKMIGTMGDPRERKLYSLILTLGVIHRMYRYLAVKYRSMHCVSMGDFLHDATLLQKLAEIYCNAPDKKLLATMSSHNYDCEFTSDILVPDLNRHPRILDTNDVNQAYRFLALAGLEEPSRLLAVGKHTSFEAA